MKKKRIIKAMGSIVLAAVLSLGVVSVPAERDVFAVTAEAASKKLEVPQNIKATSTKNSITLTWDKVSGATSYRIYLYNFNKNKWQKYKDVKGTSITLDKLKTDTTYVFKIASMNGNNKGSESKALHKNTGNLDRIEEKNKKEVKALLDSYNIPLPKDIYEDEKYQYYIDADNDDLRALCGDKNGEFGHAIGETPSRWNVVYITYGVSNDSAVYNSYDSILRKLRRDGYKIDDKYGLKKDDIHEDGYCGWADVYDKYGNLCMSIKGEGPDDALFIYEPQVEIKLYKV